MQVDNRLNVTLMRSKDNRGGQRSVRERTITNLAAVIVAPAIDGASGRARAGMCAARLHFNNVR